MSRLAGGLRTAVTTGDEALGRHWPVWVPALFLYALAGLVLLTRVRIPSTLHLVVFIMATAVLSVTAIKIEWGILALALILPFSRPGITIDPDRIFHISGFNFALVGVSLAYTLRYLADKSFALKGVFIRRTDMDRWFFAFGFLVLISCLWSFNSGASPRVMLRTGLYLKEQALYFLWFYVLVSMLRTPSDLRRFMMLFAVAGLIASIYGMVTRFAGGEAVVTQGLIEENLEEGAGGRMEGGWLGLGHPNMFAALLLMTVPLWFFAVGHLRRAFHRFMADIAVINGFLGLLFTYSRSAWIGTFLGIGLVGLADRRALQRIVFFAVIFIIAAQTTVYFTLDMNLVDIVTKRFEQLQKTTFSARPYIYASTFTVIRQHPLLGVGLGAFAAYAPATPMGWVPTHSHNVYLAYAAEAGIPAAVIFGLIMLKLIGKSVRNLKAIGRLPGYGFVALGTAGALIGLTVQTMAVQVFHHRILGFGFYALAALIVSLDRMIREGRFDDLGPEPSAGGRASGVWIGS